MRSTIICVDDDKWLLSTLSDQLIQWFGENYAIEKALSGQEGLDIINDCLAENMPISLVISDYIMPGMKGDAFLEQVKLITPLTRRIMLTGYSAPEGITNAINKAGIYRYLTKPWDTKDLMLTVLQAIRSYEQEKQTEQLNERNKALCGTLEKVASSLQNDLKLAINAIALAVELREGGVSGHAERVAELAVKFGKDMGMTDANLKMLETAALLHDCGRLAFTDEEIEGAKNLKAYSIRTTALKQAENAQEMIGRMEERVVSGVMYHTERADGKGAYGMDKSSIPLEAKIIGLCDYYDTLCMALKSTSQLVVLSAMRPHTDKIFDSSLFEKFSNLEIN